MLHHLQEISDIPSSVNVSISTSLSDLLEPLLGGALSPIGNFPTFLDARVLVSLY